MGGKGGRRGGCSGGMVGQGFVGPTCRMKMEGCQWRAGQPGSQEHAALVQSGSLHPSLPPSCTSSSRLSKH